MDIFSCEVSLIRASFSPPEPRRAPRSPKPDGATATARQIVAPTVPTSATQGSERSLCPPLSTDFPYEPGPQRLMALMAGSGVFVYPVKVPRVIYPDRIAPAHKGRFVHQDHNVIRKQDMFTMWMPLAEIPQRAWSTRGPARLLPCRLGTPAPIVAKRA